MQPSSKLVVFFPALETGPSRDNKLPDGWIVAAIDFILIDMSQPPQRQLHIRLPRTHPDVAHDDIVDRDRIACINLHDVRSARFHFRKHHFPLSVFVRGRRASRTNEVDCDLLPVRAPTPHSYRCIPLHHHAVADEFRQSHFAVHQAQREHKKQE